MNELASYVTVAQAAEVLGTTERRIRQWQSLGVLAPAARRGLLQYRRPDVIRGAVLLQLQAIFGDASPLAVELAKAVPAEQLDAVLTEDEPRIRVTRPEGRFDINLGLNALAPVRQKLAAVPV
jgi:hypothetical protein